MRSYTKVSVVVPVYNEVDTIREILQRIEDADVGNLQKEILVIDDGSTDGTRQIIESIPKIRKFFHTTNRGKGGAIRTGFENATGDILIIQDADLEYDPSEYIKLIEPITAGNALVVYGSRFFSGAPRVALRLHHYLANRLLTIWSNICSGIVVTDMETCYKAFDRDVYEKLAPRLTSHRFGIEPELTARVAKLGVPLYEVGISYHRRMYTEGKKINWRDGIAALWHIVHFNFFSR